MPGVDRQESMVSSWSALQKRESAYAHYQYPQATVVIPTWNSDRNIARTLDSVYAQDYPSLEVIVVDGGSTDRTLRVVRAYYGEMLRAYSVTGYRMYDLLNKGIALANGRYLNFLFPGDLYLQPDTTRDAMALALDHDLPDLVFGGSRLLDQKGEVSMLFRPLDLAHLCRGKVPTTLPACWFRAELFERLGPFETHLEMRGDLEFLCRVLRDSSTHVVSTSRVYVDHELRRISHGWIVTHFTETLRVIKKHFGIWAAARWLVQQKDGVRMVRSWLHSLRIALFGHPHKRNK